MQNKSINNFRQAMRGYISRSTGQSTQQSATVSAMIKKVLVPSDIGRLPLRDAAGDVYRLQNPDGTFKPMKYYDL